MIEWSIGQQVRLKEAYARTGRFLGVSVSAEGVLVSCKIEEDPASTSLVGASLTVWPGTGGGANNIEQPFLAAQVPEMVTCLVATVNPVNETALDLVQNVVVAGTDVGAYIVLDLNNMGEGKAGVEKLLTRVLHSDRVSAVALSLDGTHFMSASESGTVFVCELRLSRDSSRYATRRCLQYLHSCVLRTLGHSRPLTTYCRRSCHLRLLRRHDTRIDAMDTNETLLIDDAVTLAERTTLQGVEAQIQQLQADLVEQQSINNYQVEAASQEREKVRLQ